jgi:hypothetical protein
MIFTEVKKICGVQRPQTSLLPTFVIEWKAKFKLEASENKVVIFFPDLLKPQVKKGWETSH